MSLFFEEDGKRSYGLAGFGVGVVEFWEEEEEGD